VPHLVYLAYGFPPAAKSGSYRMRAVANAFAARGWDVTAVSLADASWRRETGIDPTTLQGLHPRIRRVGIDVAREDLEPDLLRWSEERAKDPDGWRTAHFERTRADFPEQVFGLWRDAFAEAVERVHAERPADLLMASPMPYVTLSAARHLHRTAGVPYVVDYRDGWSLDVVSGDVAFEEDSPQGLIERDVLSHASQVWFVNGRIKDFYADRYADLVERFRVVRNGFDPDLLDAGSDYDKAEPPLRFGYLGTMTLGLPQLTALLDGWRKARREEPLLKGATLEFRGHMGAGYASGAGGHAALVAARQGDGVSYGGPVRKSEVHDAYRGWDALVLALIGGRYVTSGKVYEYLATGHPIMSAHAKDHAAAEVLEGYPLWAPTESLEPDDLAAAFVRAAHLAVEATVEQRRAAREHAERFTRARLVEPAVEGAIELVAEPSPVSPEPAAVDTSVDLPAVTPRPGAKVVLLGTTKLVPVALRTTVPGLRQAGYQVTVLSRLDSKPAEGLGVKVRRLKASVGGRPGRLSPRWVQSQWRTRVVPRLVEKVKLPRRTWTLVRTDAAAWAALREADVLVALDRYAAYAVRRAALMRPGTEAVLGLTEARYRLLPDAGPETAEA